MSELRIWLREFGWRLRGSDVRAIRISEFRCRWFPYRAGPGSRGPVRWQWPDVLRRPLR